MQQNDHDYLKTTTPPSHSEGQESSEALTVCVGVPEPNGREQSTPSKAGRPTERTDPSIVEMVHILDNPTRFDRLLVEHGLSVAPPPSSASSSTNGTSGLLEKRGPGKPRKTDAEIWGVCCELGFNPDMPWCRGEVLTIVRKGPRGGRPSFRCRFCRKQLSQLRGLPGAQQSSVASPGNFFCSTDSLGRPNARMSKHDIVWIVYCMSKGLSARKTAELGGSDIKCGSCSSVRWRQLVREAVSRSLAGRPRMGGSQERVQVGIFTAQLRWSTGVRPSLLLVLQAESTGELRFVHVEHKNPGLVADTIAGQVLPETQIVSSGGVPFSGIEAAEDSDGPMRLVHITSLQDDDDTGEPAAKKKSLSPFLNTQKLRGAWRYTLKNLRQIGKIRDADFLKVYLDWLSWNSLNGSGHCKDPFLRLLDCIAKAYKC